MIGPIWLSIGFTGSEIPGRVEEEYRVASADHLDTIYEYMHMLALRLSYPLPGV